MTRPALIFTVLLGTASAASTQLTPSPLMPAPYRAAAQPVLAPAGDVGYALNDWRRLRQSAGYAFADYARFLIANPGWPGEATLRRNAEKQMRAGENANTVVAFFRSEAPKTGNGYARLAEANAALGRSAEALAAAREAWGAGDLSASDEAALFARFGPSFTTADHDRRVDALLFARKASDAYRMLPYSSAGRRAAFNARIAMHSRSPNTEVLWNAVSALAASDAGLLMDRLRYLRDGNNNVSARWLAARPHNFTYRPADPERFYEMLLFLARHAYSAGQYAQAHDIARQVDDTFPAGVDISLKPLGVRDEYTSLTWLAGEAAMSGMRRPADAVRMFVKYANGGRSLQVASKGYYWAGRAALMAGRTAEANGYFQKAAAYPELFYGQLALERLGRPVPVPGAAPMPTEAQRAAFRNKRLVRALGIVRSQGRTDEKALFVRALSEDINTDTDRGLAVELSRTLGLQDLAVWTARSARNDGSAFYVRAAYPTHSSAAPGGRLWSMTHGITRQESSFDRYAVSHAGARGLMQLMPGTAREQAGKMGMGYDYGRLTSDPAYNVTLGSAYYSRLLNTWDGNHVLAVASYNAGAGNVRKWVRNYGDPRRPGADIVRWIEQIPFTETRGYVQRVLENSVVYDRLNPAQHATATFHLSSYLGKPRPG